jgi:hypothetical protein
MKLRILDFDVNLDSLPFLKDTILAKEKCSSTTIIVEDCTYSHFEEAPKSEEAPKTEGPFNKMGYDLFLKLKSLYNDTVIEIRSKRFSF